MLKLTDVTLLPFYGLASLFFLVQATSTDWRKDAVSSVVLKAAPIWYLFAYTKYIKPPSLSAVTLKTNGKRKLSSSSLSTTFSSSSSSSGELSTFNIEQSYKNYISLGLAVSSVGDILIAQKWALIPGGLVFGVAHVLYVFAFRTRGTRAKFAWAIAPLALVSLYTIASNVLHSYVFVTFVFLYNIMISATVISALCCYENNRTSLAAFFAAIGASLFGISDYLIAFDLFVNPIPYSHILIMVTYYSAQLFLAVSVER